MNTTQTTTRRVSGAKVAPATSANSAEARGVRETTTHPIPDTAKWPAIGSDGWVIYSHHHSDHVGATSSLPKDVPHYAQRATAERLSAHADPNRDGSWMRSSCR
ncbi:hypothetical protein [Agromyces sp. ZXT2-6]|uniref:hypothetical protein n=1 Tax=Agromyces sp. ZXT2-6 TaxID=3461153 RepID=UPI00405522BC